MKKIILIALGIFFASSGIGVLSLFLFRMNIEVPTIKKLEDFNPSLTTKMVIRNGEELETIEEFFKENRSWVHPNEIPVIVKKAFLAAEDEGFYEHEGISFSAIFRAMIANLLAGEKVQGASTITMQLSRSLFLDQTKAYTRKIKEALIAWELERNLTKDEILGLYLNQIYLGHGCYGIKACANVYFKKSLEGLSVAEAALLAGMPKAPSRFSPFKDPKRAKIRQKYVLSRMKAAGFISEEEMQKSVSETLLILNEVKNFGKAKRFYTEEVRRTILESLGEERFYNGGYTIELASRLKFLEASKKSVQLGLSQISKKNGNFAPVKNEPDLNLFLKEEEKKVSEQMSTGIQFFPDGSTKLWIEEKAPDFLFFGWVDSMDDSDVICKTGFGDYKIPKKHWAFAHPEANVWNFESPVAAWKPMRIFKRGDVVWLRHLEKGIASLEQIPKEQAALVSFDLNTGAVLAMEGGFDYDTSEFNRAKQAKRQAGSLFKPIIFALGFERGFHPATLIDDSPIVYRDEEAGTWKPDNYEEKFFGDTTLRMALVHSRNVPTIKLLQSLGVKDVIEYASRLGLKGDFPQDLSIALGSASTSVFDLAKAFGVFGRFGKNVEPFLIRRILDKNQKVIFEATDQEPANLKQFDFTNCVQNDFGVCQYPSESDPNQLVDPRIAYQITHVLKEVVLYGTGSKAREIGRTVAGKTGTTSDYRDAWFLGYTPDVLTAVWVGYDDYSSIEKSGTGAGAALPIWNEMMKTLVQDFPDRDFNVPIGIEFHSIHPEKGNLLSSADSQAVTEAFLTPVEGKKPMLPTSRSKSENVLDLWSEESQ